MKNGFILGAMAVGLVVAPSLAQAQRYITVGPQNGYTYYGYPPYGASADQWNQWENGYSGTLGRQGLGADPRHPEGPGNVSSPR